MSWSFKIALAADCIAVAIAFYFIITDSIKSSSADNGMLSMAALGMCAWIGISYFLYTSGHTKIASIMAWVPAIPLLGYGLLILIMVIAKPDFR